MPIELTRKLNARIDAVNAWTVAQAIPGRTDGVAVPAGYLGERISTAFGSYTATTTLADVPGATLSLSAGVWRIYYSISMDVVTGSISGNASYGQVQITDNANTLLGTSVRCLYAKTTASVFNEAIGTLSAEEIINISTATTYKLRAYLGNVSGVGSAFLFPTSNTNFGAATFFAVRIA